MKLNVEPEFAPTLVAGGGPAGVVDVPKRDVGALFVGVVEEVLPNKPAPGLGAPNRVEVDCEVVGVSVPGLFGVENREKLEGALFVVVPPVCVPGPNKPAPPVLELLPVVEPKLSPLGAALLGAPKVAPAPPLVDAFPKSGFD